MRIVIVALVLLAPQDKAADRLKKEGWKAVDALVAKGAESRAELEEAAKSEDGDVSFYAKAALAELDAGGTAWRTKGVEEGPARKVIETLLAEAGQKGALDGVPDKTASVAAGLTLAEALERLSIDLGIEFATSEDRAWHVSTVASKGPRFSHGSVRARLENVKRQSQNDFDKTSVSVTYSGRLEVDPSLRLTDRYPNVKVVEAVDDTGAAVKKPPSIDRFGPRSWRGKEDPSLPITITMAAPEGAATKLSKLRLVVDLTCEKQRDTFTFEKPLEAKNAEKTVGNVKAVLKELVKEGDEFKLDLELTSTVNFEAPDWDTIKLTDSNGGEYQRWSSSSSSGGRRATYKLGYRNPGGLGDPASFSFSMVTATSKRTVYFEFRDVPIK
jgi:hypothetical protein